MCRECAFLYYDRPRCTSIQPGTGNQCGLWKHHVPKTHVSIIPTDAPWFPGNAEKAFAKLPVREQVRIVMEESNAYPSR